MNRNKAKLPAISTIKRMLIIGASGAEAFPLENSTNRFTPLTQMPRTNVMHNISVNGVNLVVEFSRGNASAPYAPIITIRLMVEIAGSLLR